MSSLQNRKNSKNKAMPHQEFEDGHTEETPLLQQQSDFDRGRTRPATSILNQGSWRRMAGVFLLMIVSYLAIGGIVSYKRLSLPASKSVADSVNPDDFSGDWAWQHLEQIAQRPHPINSRDNLRVHDYLAKVVKKLQEEAALLNRTVEIADDDVKLTLAKNFLGGMPRQPRLEFYESSNILVRVVGTEGQSTNNLKGHPEAVVVDAHYDSVLIGSGATDDGIAVAVCLEMIRNLINHPVKHNVIFNINNGEEVGLFGAASFMKHKWSSNVKAFVNLEGAGAGGRALLFRSSNKQLAKFYSKAGNSPHANVFGNDIFKLGLIKSGTDYSVFTSHGLPGLDIAFYSRRAFYHTLHDDIEHTSRGSVQHMGNTGLTAVRNIADSDYLVNPKDIISNEPSIYYDVAGLFMLVYSFGTYQTLNYNLLIIAPAFVLWAIYAAKKHGLTYGVVLRSYFAMLLSFAAAIATSIGFAAFFNVINPMLVYGEHWLGFFFFVFQSCTVIILVQWAWARYEFWLKGDVGPLEIALERINVDTEQIANVAMVLFWWTMLIGATLAARKMEIGLYYFYSWFVATSMISAYFAVYPRRRGTFWTLARLWINVIPLIMVLDIAVTNTIAMSQTLVDGTPPFAIMALLSLCALNCVMPLVPSIHRSANFPKMGQVSVFLSVALLISACIVFPYNAEEAPNKLIWRQVYDLDNKTSYVTVKTMNNLEPIMKLIPSAKESVCGADPITNVLTQCVYVGAIPKIVAESKNPLDDIIKSKVSKPEHQKEKEDGPEDDPESDSKPLLRTTHLTWKVKDSRLCQFLTPEDVEVESLLLDGFDPPLEYNTNEIKTATQNGMVGFKHEFDQTWDLKITYKVNHKDDPALEATLGCLYDEWVEEKIPAFTAMRNSLPPYALLGGGKGPGLLIIQKKVFV